MKGVDGYTHAQDDRAHALLSALLAEAFADPAPWERATRREVAEVLALESRTNAPAVIAAHATLHEGLLLALGERLDAIVERPEYSSSTAFSAYSHDPGWHQQNVLELLFARLLRKRLAYREETLVALLGVAARLHGLSALAIVGHVERKLDGAQPGGALRQAVQALLDETPRWHRTEKLHDRLTALLAGPPAKKATPRKRGKGDPKQLLAGIDEPWLERLRGELSKTGVQLDAWRDVLALAEETRERSQPTKRWLADARQGIEAIGTESALAALAAVFEAVPALPAAGDHHSAKQLAGAAAELLRALAWGTGAMAGVELPGSLLAALQGAAIALFTRVENIGARDAKAGAGCITALGLLAAGGRDDAVVALLELGDHLEYQAGQQAVRRALAAAAKARATSTEQLARQAVAATKTQQPGPETDDEGGAATRDTTVEGALTAAVGALRRNHAAEALSATLDAWRACKNEALIPPIAALSGLASADRPPLEGSKEQRHARWLELAKQADPGDLPRLLAALDRENQRLALEQLRALDRWPADPRLAAALCEVLETPPYRHQRTWVALVSVLVGQTDPRTKPRLAQIDVTTRRRRGEGDPWRVELGELRDALAIRTPREAPLSAPAEALLDELSALLPAPAAASKAARTSTRQAEELLAEIYANPDDDDLRRLYADLLLEGGDERGELITLQLLSEKSAAQKKRERELLAAHAVDWLGPLAPVFQRSGLRYTRGFPVAGRIIDKHLAANDKLVGHPAWSTFEELAMKGWDVPLAALTHPVLRGLRVLEGVDGETVAALLTAEEGLAPRALERLRGTFYRDDEDDPEEFLRWQRILAASGAPALRELIIDAHLDVRALTELLASPLGRQLEHLSVEVGYSDAPAWLGRLSKLRTAPPRLTLHETFRHWNLTLSRGTDGRWSKLACSYEGRPDDETRQRLDELLTRLPDGAIRELSR